MKTIEIPQSPFTPLTSHLLDVLHALEGKDIPLILVGGFVPYLRYMLFQQSAGTLHTFSTSPPQPRTTEDLDVLLQTSLLAQPEKMETLKSVLAELGYEIRSPEFKFQLVKPTDNGRSVRIDFLAKEPLNSPPYVSDIRVMPKKKGNSLHAFCTPEAIATEDNPLEICLKGLRMNGEQYEGRIHLPQPYALYLMKLFAFQDCEEKGEPFYASKHALDLYTLTALLTREEYEALDGFRTRYEAEEIHRNATNIVKGYFANSGSLGSIRLREHSNFPQENDIEGFLQILKEVFPTTIEEA